MSDFLVELRNVEKTYPFFQLRGVSLDLEPGQILGFVGPNGAGKSTTIRILMGLIAQDTGTVRVLGCPMPRDQARAKRDIGFVSEDMSLYRHATLGWHMRFVAAAFPGWDESYAQMLLRRFNLRPTQTLKGFSHGERIKAALLLALARRPRLLVLDEPTTGLDPVARHEVLSELMEVVRDESRAILFSSHNTVDVEQISDHITFIDRGRVIDSSDKETFVDRWRRLDVEMPAGVRLEPLVGQVAASTSGRLATVTTRDFTTDVPARFAAQGAIVQGVHRMTLEEIFVATVMSSRKEQEQ